MTIKNIASIAKVSPATVSRVLNGKNVSKEVYDRVQKAIEECDYVPNYMGRSLRAKRTNKILMLLPTIQNPFYSEIVNAFENRAREEGFSTLIGVTNRNPEVEKQYLELLFSKQVDGLASFIPTIEHSEISTIAEKYPFVAVCWRGDGSVNANYVCIDNIQACYDLTKYLISLGHRKIAIMNGNYVERVYEREREIGFRRAMGEAGLEVLPEYCRICGYSHREGFEACGELMTLPDPPTAIITLSDTRAVGVVRWLREHKFQLGKDVDVIGFDNVDVSCMISPEITTVEQPREELGLESARLLVGRINNPEQSARGVILQHKLIIRDTTRNIDPQKKRKK